MVVQRLECRPDTHPTRCGCSYFPACPVRCSWLWSIVEDIIWSPDRFLRLCLELCLGGIRWILADTSYTCLSRSFLPDSHCIICINNRARMPEGSSLFTFSRKSVDATEWGPSHVRCWVVGMLAMGSWRCLDVESTSLTLISRRGNVTLYNWTVSNLNESNAPDYVRSGSGFKKTFAYSTLIVEWYF